MSEPFYLATGQRTARARRTACWLAALALGAAGCSDPAPAPRGERGVSLTERLGGDPDPGFARATEPKPLRFPRDHGPHPAYRNEWWYVTGNLEDGRGRRFGFQLTFFRVGLAPGRAERGSRWATHHVWMAHFTITDAADARFDDFERFARGGDIGLAGAAREPVRVWLEDWRLERRPSGEWRLHAAAGGNRLRLELAPRKPPVLNGEAGLSRKGPGRGNASYYYALPRLAATGTLRRQDRVARVTGTAWLDREWSTSALAPGQSGWDWFGLHLADGTDVMIYRLRQDDGGTSPYSAATITDADGRPRRLGADDFRIEVTRRWTSPRGGTYPAGWLLHLPGRETPLRVRPILADQELDASVRYWEGAVDVLRGEERVGRGYVELTGYAERP